MSSVDQAKQTQLQNIQNKTRKSMEELAEIVRKSGLQKHGEIRSMFVKDLGLGFGDAQMLTLHLLNTDVGAAAREKGLSVDEILADIYKGPKASLLPIHIRLLEAIQHFGEFEIAPKKGYVSLRRKRQFAMVGPATNTRVEVGINHKNLPANSRLVPQPAGSMCQYVVKLTTPEAVDDELIGWVHEAYLQAG